MKKKPWIVLLIAGGLLVGGCMPTGGSERPTEETVDTGSVAPVCNPDSRCRAWLLFESVPSDEGILKVESLLADSTDSWVVVRADMVSGKYGFVVPVDVADQAGLDSIVTTLRGIVGSEPVILVVAAHHPAKTTESHSYVTSDEWKGFESDFETPGQQVPNSPGANPWG